MAKLSIDGHNLLRLDRIRIANERRKVGKRSRYNGYNCNSFIRNPKDVKKSGSVITWNTSTNNIFLFFHSALQVRAVAESIRVFIIFIADCFILQCLLRAKYQAKW